MPISLDLAIVQAGRCSRSARRDETIILCLTPPDNGYCLHRPPRLWKVLSLPYLICPPTFKQKPEGRFSALRSGWCAVPLRFLLRLPCDRTVPREKSGQEPRVASQILTDRRRLGRMGVQPPRRLRPLEREVGDAARPRHLGQRVQCRTQHRRLSLAVAGLPQQVAQRVLDCRQPRHAHRSRQVRDARQGNCAYPRCLDLSLYQSHGPAADRSTRYQDDDVHPISL